MKKNQILIGLAIVALMVIGVFFYMKKEKSTPVITSTTSIDSVSKSSTAAKTESLTTNNLTIAYRFQIVDHTTLKNWHLFVSLNGATPTEITVAGVGCTNADGYNYIPITIDCPVSPATTPVTVDITLKKGTTIIKHDLKTDDIASCGSPDILLLPVCGFKLRQFPGTTPILNKIVVTVSEVSTDTYDDIITWPPTVH